MVPETAPRAALVAPPGQPLASCRRPNEASVLTLTNLEKIWRSGGKIWPNDGCFGDCIYFCRAENDLGGDVSLAARLSWIVPNCVLNPAVVITISTFFHSSFWLKSRRQKTDTGRMAAISVGAFFRGRVLMCCFVSFLPPVLLFSLLVLCHLSAVLNSEGDGTYNTVPTYHTYVPTTH